MLTTGNFLWKWGTYEQLSALPSHWILSHEGKQPKQWHWKNSSLLLTIYESEAHTKDFHLVGFFHTNMLWKQHQNFSFPVVKRSPNASRHRFSLGAPSTLNFNTPSRGGAKYFDFFTLEGPHIKEDSQSYYIDYLSILTLSSWGCPFCNSQKKPMK